MGFNVELYQECNSNCEVCTGRIRIGEFEEAFESSLEYWTVEQYEEQWRAAISHVLDERRNACLITSVTDPKTANFLFWWPIYVNGDLAILQNQILFLERYRGTFELENPYQYLEPYENTSEDGQPISEWSVSLMDLKAWRDSTGS